MKAIYKYNVLARLPERLKTLEKIAYNLWFSWHHDVAHLFRRMDPDLWDTSKHNPVYMLGNINQERMDELAADAGFLAQMDRAYEELERYLAVKPSFHAGPSDEQDRRHRVPLLGKVWQTQVRSRFAG